MVPRKIFVLLALLTWAFAVVGAAGVAYWLKLSLQDAVVLVAIVAIAAFFGSFVPMWRLGSKA